MNSQPVPLSSAAEIAALRERLKLAEETLEALSNGWVDALVVSGSNGERIVSLKNALDDIAERKRHEARLEYQANHDALTGLANRRCLLASLTKALIGAQRYRHRVTVAFIDLDHFKRINDSLGHDVGDKVLQVIAQRLQSCLRVGDTVARHGGDEFVLIIDHSDESVIARIMPKLLESVSAPVVVDHHILEITCSIGFSLYPIDGTDTATLLKNADAAMYRAKEQGRNNFQFYTPELNLKITRRLAMESNLRHALERNEFFLQYQPKVELHTGNIVGTEALIRWTHAGTIIMPGEFIGLAEETGLIMPIGEWLLRTACAQNKAWQDAYLPPMVISVNLSPRQFRDKNLPELVEQVLRETGLDAIYLDLEVTESMVMDNIGATVVILRRLKDMGVSISIDDFGTGYSNLGYLHRLPIDVLKIDQSIVRGITEDSHSEAIVASIIALAHIMKLAVVAEGVQTVAELAYLRLQGCDLMQGHLFSKPVSAQALAEMFRR